MFPLRTRRRLHGALLLTVAGLAAVPASPAAAAGTVTVARSAGTLTVTGGPEPQSIDVSFRKGASGFTGTDTLRGGPGDDQLAGSSGSDSLTGDDGVDSADGGPLSGSDSGVDTCDAETEIRCEG